MNIQMNDETLVLSTEVLARCFCCSAIRTVEELAICSKCGAACCGISPCNARCVCDSLRHVEHPEDAKAFYGIMDELNIGGVDKARAALLESQLKVFEQRHGW